MPRGTIQNGGGQNDLGNPKGTPNYSTFPHHSHHYTTESFGRNDVCYIFNGIEGDQDEIAPKHEITSYTLKAPLMTPVYKEKDYIMVARQAILPRNWEKFHVAPNIGEDINPNEVGTAVSTAAWADFFSSINTWKDEIQNSSQMDKDSVITDGKAWTANLLKYLVLVESIFSYGSLTAKLGARFAVLYENTNKDNADTIIDEVYAELKKDIVAVRLHNTDENIIWDIKGGTKSNRPTNAVSFEEGLDIIRENPGKYTIDTIYVGDAYYVLNNQRAENVRNAVATDLANAANKLGTIGTYERPFDLARLWAYQLACAEFFTNSHVDYIYSAELYRQYVGNLLETIQTGANAETFTWNGIDYQYDYLSAHLFAYANANGQDANGNFTDAYLEYLASIFSFRRSLKYLDYFTGSKVRPLATGDVTVNPDAQGRINMIDVTKKGLAYKFYNALNRVGHKAGDYALEMMGVKQAHDWHNPMWLASTRSAVNAEVRDMTGEGLENDALTQRAQFYGVDGRYKFNYKLDRDAIVIGITWYDVERSYGKGVHRSFMQEDRYDQFNSYMQYAGDQQIYGEELNAKYQNPFGYTPAYEEFKQQYNEVSGGFMTKLPGYTFIDAELDSDRIAYEGTEHIGPEFIRSKPVELDRFYQALTGVSLANRFHFIVDYYTENNAKRKMSFNPGIGM